jgi:hypothetical protein
VGSEKVLDSSTDFGLSGVGFGGVEVAIAKGEDFGGYGGEFRVERGRGIVFVPSGARAVGELGEGCARGEVDYWDVGHFRMVAIEFKMNTVESGVFRRFARGDGRRCCFIYLKFADAGCYLWQFTALVRSFRELMETAEFRCLRRARGALHGNNVGWICRCRKGWR